jgi:hypothetical protein
MEAYSMYFLLNGHSSGMPLYISDWDQYLTLYPKSISETYTIAEFKNIIYN